MGGLTAPDRPKAFPWRDLRLWAAPALLAGTGALANLAWGGFLPGRAPATWAVAAAAAVLGLVMVDLSLHPRSQLWTAEGNVVPSVAAVLLAFAVAPPALGPRLLVFLWTTVMLLFLWVRARDLVRSAVRMTLQLPTDGSGGFGEMAPAAPRGASVDRRRMWWQGRSTLVPGDGPLGERTGRAMLDALVGAGLLAAVCDWGAGSGAVLATGALRTLAAGLAVGAVLALAAWTGRADALRRAAAEDAGVQHGFSRLWWWAVVPAVGACLAIGVALPTYPALLQGGRLQHVVLGYADYAAGYAGGPEAPVVPTAQQAAAQNTTGLVLAGLCLVALILAWPLRRYVERVVDRAVGMTPVPGEPRLTFAERLRWWWGRTVETWRRLFGRRRPPVRHGTWRPLGAPEGRRGGEAPAWEAGVPPAAHDARARVRVAYGHVLREARQAGFARHVADTPRRFLGWVVTRARPARFPLESLTAAYEYARYSLRPVAAEQAQQAEGDARAAAYGLNVAVHEQRRHAGQPDSDPGLKWTAPRGVRWKG